MFELKINLGEMSTVISGIGKGGITGLKLIKSKLQEDIRAMLQSLVNAEISVYLGRSRYERKSKLSRGNYRNGYHKERTFTIKGLGGVRIRIPRDRDGKYASQIIPKYQRYDQELGGDLQRLFLSGVSTRKIGGDIIKSCG